jgi:hypothetical protein
MNDSESSVKELFLPWFSDEVISAETITKHLLEVSSILILSRCLNHNFTRSTSWPFILSIFVDFIGYHINRALNFIYLFINFNLGMVDLGIYFIWSDFWCIKTNSLFFELLFRK